LRKNILVDGHLATDLFPGLEELSVLADKEQQSARTLEMLKIETGLYWSDLIFG
jgi:hypothetical protein